MINSRIKIERIERKVISQQKIIKDCCWITVSCQRAIKEKKNYEVVVDQNKGKVSFLTIYSFISSRTTFCE